MIETLYKPNPVKHQPPATIRQLLTICPRTGQFIHIPSGNPWPLYTRAKAAPSINVHSQTYSASKLAYWLAFNVYPATHVKPLDGNRLNFRADNLAMKSPQAKPYRVRLRNREGKLIHLGYFDTKEEAQAVREMFKALPDWLQ